MSRDSSLSNINLPNWRWRPFLSRVKESLSYFDLQPLTIPRDFLEKKTNYRFKKNIIDIKTMTWGCKTLKLKNIRAACVDAGEIASVINLVLQPSENFDLPFFGADFVTLPSGHLLALDLQPVLKNDMKHTEQFLNKLIPIHTKWQSKLPYGGAIPEEAKPFFSPAFLWTRLPLDLDSERLIDDVLFPAFDEYLKFYLKLVKSANIVSRKRAGALSLGQKNYIKYRADKDPARGMLTRFYGKEWTESYIHNILFNSNT